MYKLQYALSALGQSSEVLSALGVDSDWCSFLWEEGLILRERTGAELMSLFIEPISLGNIYHVTKS